jgi:hypothetical protein
LIGRSDASRLDDELTAVAISAALKEHELFTDIDTLVSPDVAEE